MAILEKQNCDLCGTEIEAFHESSHLLVTFQSAEFMASNGGREPFIDVCPSVEIDACKYCRQDFYEELRGIAFNLNKRKAEAGEKFLRDLSQKLISDLESVEKA